MRPTICPSDRFPTETAGPPDLSGASTQTEEPDTSGGLNLRRRITGAPHVYGSS